MEIGVAEHAPRVWVLNFHLHVVEDGRLLPAIESPYIWLGGAYMSTSPSIAPNGMASIASVDDQDDAVLETLVQAVKVAYINNFPSALFALGAQVLSVHYEGIKQLEEGVPVAILYGDVACGKSRILDACLSLNGDCRIRPFSKELS